jgi:hypothetical protein
MIRRAKWGVFGVASISTLVIAAAFSKQASAQTAQKPADPAITAHAQVDAAAPTPVTPPAPPPWTSSPTSMSGSDLLPSTPAPTTASGSSDAALEARLSDLEARVHEDEHKMREQNHQPWWVSHLNFTGYLQPQLLIQAFNAAASPNLQAGQATLPQGIGSNDVTATANGTTTNKDVFRLRRARLKLEAMPNEYSKFVFEIDPSLAGGTNAGNGTIARNIEAMGIAKWCKDWSWYTEFGMGIFKLPFDFEIVQTDADRPFIERSWGEQNMFPSEFDEGIHETTYGFKKKLRVDFAVVNGTMIGEPNFTAVPDLNKSKDVVGKANYDFGPFDVGVGAYYGQGAETDAAALKFKQFPRWAGNAHGGFHHTLVKLLGSTKLYAEIVLAKNMDRGLNYGKGIGLPAIPADVANGFLQDHDERSVWIRVEQDITRWFTVGIRYDFYSPDTAQKNDARDTYSFVGAVHFTRWLQWMIEFDHAIDNVHAAGAGAPSKQIESFSNVLQARF